MADSTKKNNKDKQKKKTSGKTSGSSSSSNSRAASGGKDSRSGRSDAKDAGLKSAPSEKTKRVREEIWAIAAMAVGVFLIAALQLSAAGRFGDLLKTFFMGIFGAPAFALPYFLIVFGILVLMKRVSKLGARSLVLFLLMFFFITLINAGRLVDPADPTFSFLDIAGIFSDGAAGKNGGLIGTLAGAALIKFIGKVGLYIFSFSGLLIIALLLMNTPLSHIFDKFKEKRAARKRRLLEKAAVEASKRKYDDEDGYEKTENKPPSLLSGRAGTLLKRMNIIGYVNDDSLFKNNTDDTEGFGVEPPAPKLEGTGLEGDAAPSAGLGVEPPRMHIKGLGLDDENGDYAGDALNMSGHKNLFEDNKILKGGVSGEGGGISSAGGTGFAAGGTLGGASYGEDGTGFASGGMAGGVSGEGEADSAAGGRLGGASYGEVGTGFAAGGMAGGVSGEAGMNPAAGGKAGGGSTGTAGNKGSGDAGGAEFRTMMKLNTGEDANLFRDYELPPIGLLSKGAQKHAAASVQRPEVMARKLEQTLEDFNVKADVTHVTVGPAVTRYELQPGKGVKVKSIKQLESDIALNLEAKSIRIEAPIPGKAAVGIEVANDRIDVVALRDIIESANFKTSESKITFAVGMDISGKSIVADLKDMPHLLIAGSTGSGKSVCINSIIMSILYKSRPDEVRLVLVDPKVVELGNYNGIPHLLVPVVTEPGKAASALNWAVQEMMARYEKFSKTGVRDLASYNKHMEKCGDETERLPQIVIIIDELADLMMVSPAKVEESICRLAQMARAAGMHLIVATQRPSVDVITGVIKANIPSRIAFAVSSQVDSRTILDMSGAEHLMGRGDMLFNPLGRAKPLRVQGTFVTDSEVHSVIDYVRKQMGVEYAEDVINTIEKGGAEGDKDGEDVDELLPDAIETVVMAKQASASMLQRRFRIGYNRAARLVEMMEARGIVGAADGARPRAVMLSEEEFFRMKRGSEPPRSGHGDSEGEEEDEMEL
ncbi:MAG: DNA translocase FtsK [Clostridiales Family XIII bacterium]|jgi:S-DNA-T family DNA segregation ATPase FtsK/SpoIIIE|nr:DNA translocase FtsK [Clostridiales Family XIII bacterium]